MFWIALKPETQINTMVTWIILCSVSLLGGCQRRAYTDLYVERMAGEIRELEDRIYEYDSAYRQTEGELDVIRSENDSLRKKLAEQPSPYQRGNGSTLRGRLEDLRDSRKETSPKRSPAITPQPDPIADVLPSGLDPKPTAPTKPVPNPAIPDKSLLESPPPPIPSTPLELEPPEIDLGVPTDRAPSSLMPPPLSSFPITTIPLPTSIETETVSQHQIQLSGYVTQATATNVAEPYTGLSPRKPIALATGKTAKNQSVIGRPHLISHPSDNRVVEIGFHPTQCRGGNRESDPAEDGLRLVMQPRNQLGEFLEQPASMTLVVVDPSRPEGQSKIGRWTWTAEELQASLEPIGISQGFHLAIAWQSIRPTSKSVQVHVRYEMPDGRRLVNQKEINLYAPSLGSDAWTPRVPK